MLPPFIGATVSERKSKNDFWVVRGIDAYDRQCGDITCRSSSIEGSHNYSIAESEGYMYFTFDPRRVSEV